MFEVPETYRESKTHICTNKTKFIFREETNSAVASFMQVLYLGKLEFGDVGFCGGRKTEEKPKEQDENIRRGDCIEPEPHWWEARALTTAPFLLPNIIALV